MFDVNISASTPAELTAAIVALAAAMQNTPAQAAANPTPTVAPQMAAPAPVSAPVQTAPPPAAPMTVNPTPVVPAQAAAPVTPASISAAPTPTAPPAVPVTAAPTYNRDQIMIAGAALIDAGKMSELTALLGAFGVQAVTQLGQEQLGAFATELRKLGAQI